MESPSLVWTGNWHVAVDLQVAGGTCMPAWGHTHLNTYYCLSSIRPLLLSYIIIVTIRFTWKWQPRVPHTHFIMIHIDDSVYALLEPTHAHTISAHTWHMHYRPIYPARTFVPRLITVVDRFPCTNKRLAVFWTRVCSHLTGSCLIEPTWRERGIVHSWLIDDPLILVWYTEYRPAVCSVGWSIINNAWTSRRSLASTWP